MSMDKEAMANSGQPETQPTNASQAPKPGATPAEYDCNALLIKSQRYIELMERSDSESWEHALWSAMSLELLMRAALASISPVLLAEAKGGDWKHIYYALGFSPLESKYSPRSIATAEVIKRLGELLPSFREVGDFCTRHTGHRNAELHSGDTPFEGVNASTWHGNFYTACKVLLASMDLGLDDLLSLESAKVAEVLIHAAADKNAKAVLGDIAKAKKDWEGKLESERATAAATAQVWATRFDGHRVNCPACTSAALVVGDPVAPAQRTLEGDMVIETQECLPSRFECVACGLRISGLSRLSAAGLAARYKKTTMYDAAALFQPEDEYYAYEEDNNEPF